MHICNYGCNFILSVIFLCTFYKFLCTFYKSFYITGKKHLFKGMRKLQFKS